MRLVDAHCHLEAEELRDGLDGLLKDARKAGLVGFVTCAVRPEEWSVSQELSARFPDVHFTLGIHPWFVEESHVAVVEGLADAAQHGAKAIGEIGLDRKIDTPPFNLQLRLFERQLAIANAIPLPVVIHCRGAFDDLVRALDRVGPPEAGGVVHAFSGSVEIAEELIKRNLSFSMGGALTYRNSRKRERVLERIFPSHFLLETDSPDMPPVHLRGMPNIPINILHNLRAAAETLGEPVESVAEATTENANRIFRLGL